MSLYASVAEFKSRVPERVYGAFADAMIEAHLTDASEVVDSYVGGRGYALPLVDAGNDVKACVTKVAQWTLLSAKGFNVATQSDEAVKMAHDEAMAWLRENQPRLIHDPNDAGFITTALFALGAIASVYPQQWSSRRGDNPDEPRLVVDYNTVQRLVVQLVATKDRRRSVASSAASGNNNHNSNNSKPNHSNSPKSLGLSSNLRLPALGLIVPIANCDWRETHEAAVACAHGIGRPGDWIASGLEPVERAANRVTNVEAAAV